MPRLGKITGFFLLIVFTLQVTDLTCLGEDKAFNSTGIQGEYQFIHAVDMDNGSSAYSPVGILDKCQCPCHLSFTYSPFTGITSYQVIGLPLTSTSNLSLKKISPDIFQPPKVLI